MFRENIRKIPNWAMTLAFYLSIVVSSCFTAMCSLDLVAQMLRVHIGVGMQVFMLLLSGAVTLGIYALFNRGVYFVLQSISRGGVLTDRRTFLRDIQMFQTARFLVCVPTAILSFFFPLWLMAFSVFDLCATILCYIGLYLYMEKAYLAPGARRRVLLIMFVPILLYFLISGVLL